MRKALVTEASGFIGRHLCHTLKQQGWHVTALARQKCDIECDVLVTGDLSGILPLDLCKGIDSVFHLAGIAHAFGLSAEEQSLYQQVNVDGTRHLLELVNESEVERVVYFSSIKAMGEVGQECVDETVLSDDNDAYGLSKLEAERLVLEFGQKTNRHVVCLRPCLVYGPGLKGNLLKMLSAIDRGRFPPIAPKNQKRSMVSIYDLVSLAIQVVDQEKANQQVFIVSDGEHYNTRRIHIAMCEGLQIKAPRYSLPNWLMFLFAKVGDFLKFIIRRNVPFDSVMWKRLNESACYKSDKLKDVLSWQASQTLESVISDIVSEYKSLQK